MSTEKLKEMADLLHLSYFNPRSHKSLTFTIMKFLSEPREGMLKKHVRNKSSSKRRGRRKIVHTARKWTQQADSTSELDNESTTLEVKSLLQAIRRKRDENLNGDSSTESDIPNQESSKKSKRKKLGEIPNVQFMVITSNYDDIDNLHQLLFLQSGPRAKIRRNVQDFDGFVFGPNSFSYKIRIKLLNKMGYEVAKRIAFFLGLATLWTKIPQEDLNDLIMHFLMCPSDIKCKSIRPKAYPKNFFNNYPTERPVVDITSIRNAVKKRMKAKKKPEHVIHVDHVIHAEHHNKKSEEMEATECEKSNLECDILEDCSKKVIKKERESSCSDPSDTSVVEGNVVQCNSSNVSSWYEDGTEELIADSIEKMTKKQGQRQKRKKEPELSDSITKRRRPFTRRKEKVNISPGGKKKRVVIKKENDQFANNVTNKPEGEDTLKKQFLFRFDPTNKFDSKQLLECLNRESQNLAQKIKDPNIETKESISVLPNVSFKQIITPKPELSGSPKVISILLPPPPSSSQKNFSVAPDLNCKTNSFPSSVDSASCFKSVQSCSSGVTLPHKRRIPVPLLPKKQFVNLTPQSSQTVQMKGTSSHITQIQVPSSVIESIKGSQIEGVIRIPQNLVTGQNCSQASSSGVTNNVLSLPEVQKCLQQINSTNGKKKYVKMIKIPGNNTVPLQPNPLNLGAGKVYVFPMKPGNQQSSALPVSSAVTPFQLSNHIMVPSNIESGTPVNIPHLIQVAKNYSRAVGTTALPHSNVTVTKVKSELTNPLSFPVVSTSQGHHVFPVSLVSSSNIGSLSISRITGSSEKVSSQTEPPPLVTQSSIAVCQKSKETQGGKQQTEDHNSDSELDEEPLLHLVGHPSDDMLLQNIKDIVTGADLSTITMRYVLQKVFDKYPQYDLTYRKSFVKDTVKKVICSASV